MEDSAFGMGWDLVPAGTAVSSKGASPATARPVFPGASLVDGEIAALEVFALKGADVGLTVRSTTHGDEGKAP